MMTHDTTIPHYWYDAKAHLSQDPTMQTLLKRYPSGSITSRGDPFYTLIRSIIGQQISVAAADSLWSRLTSQLEEKRLYLTPDAILTFTEEELRGCGMSRQKISYMRNLSEFFIADAITADFWHTMHDEEVIRHITQVKGIGRWTAEMFLMFCLLRPDIFPLDDIGLQRALHQGFMTNQKPFARQKALSLAEQWRPYRSVATWYLWRSIDPSDVQY